MEAKMKSNNPAKTRTASNLDVSSQSISKHSSKAPVGDVLHEVAALHQYSYQELRQEDPDLQRVE